MPEARVAAIPPKLIFAAADHILTAAITPQNSAAIVPGAQDIFACRQLDLARDQLWLGQLASDIVAARGTDDRISFRLLPEKLGRLDVELTSHETGLSVKIEASTDDAAKLLASAQSRLVDELRAQGVRVSSAEVTHGDLSRQDKRPHPQAAQAVTEFRAPDTAKPEKTKAVQRDGRFA